MFLRLLLGTEGFSSGGVGVGRRVEADGRVARSIACRLLSTTVALCVPRGVSGRLTFGWFILTISAEAAAVVEVVVVTASVVASKTGANKPGPDLETDGNSFLSAATRASSPAASFSCLLIKASMASCS